jgi:predicted nucleotidyltransferase
MIARTFFEILRTLNDHDLRYVVIGGLAANLWGSDQVTLDVDICYARDPDNLKKMVQVLRVLDAHLRGWPKGVPEFIDEKAFRLGDSMTFETKFGAFDCLGTPSGTNGYADLITNAKTMNLQDDVAVRVASIDDIIRMKRAAGRVKDLNAVESLKLLKELRRNEPPTGE